MVWVYVLIGVGLFIGLIEWTARPRGSANGTSTVEPDVKVPRPRTPAPGWTTSSRRRP